MKINVCLFAWTAQEDLSHEARRLNLWKEGSHRTALEDFW